MPFFIPFPFPKFGNGFFYSLPVPEFWEWAFSISFPFPNFGNGIFYSRSRTLKSHSCSPLKFIDNTFGFPFCQRFGDPTKPRDDIVVVDMVADMVADREVDMVADMEVDKVANMVINMVANKKNCPKWSWKWWPT